MAKTNEQVVIDAMNYSKYGALSQAFIMQAIEQMCDSVIKEEELIKLENSFIHMPSWVGVAKEIKEKLNQRK